jgi:hypothetical protein
MKTEKNPSDLSAADLIKYLNGRRNWHGNQYRSLCGEWLRKAEIRKQALNELASEWEKNGFGSVASELRNSQHNVEVSYGDRERQPDTNQTHNQP